MAPVLATLAAVLFALSAVLYQLRIKAVLHDAGYWRVAEPVGNEECKLVPELPACEKAVLHQASGVLYLACSTPASRTHWTPSVRRYNATGRSRNDYFAVYDPVKSSVTHLKVEGFASPRGLNLHGMDVVPSAANPSELFVYAMNHRPPVVESDAPKVGADSCIEIFKTTVGSSTLTHLHTVEDPSVILVPNDVVGSDDGKSFWFTNEHAEKMGWTHYAEVFLRYRTSSVGYCHVEEGCKFSVKGLHGSNGIAKTKEGVFYVASSVLGEITVLEKQIDNSLVVTDTITLDRSSDNLSIDSEGTLWSAGHVKAMYLVLKVFDNPSLPCPSSAMRITLNTGRSAFFGEKYKVEKPFEDDGTLASGATTVVHDAQRGRLFVTGVVSHGLTVCKA